MENKEKIIIYGASGGGKKVFLTLQNMGIQVDCFVDSDSKKWGTKFCDKEVKSPEEISNNKKIIIASELNQEKIEITLSKLGLLKNVIMKEELMIPYMEKITYDISKKKAVSFEERKVFLELLEGVPQQPDGLADWTKDIAKLLVETGEKVKIITSKKMGNPIGDLHLYDFIETDYSTYWRDVETLFCYLEQQLPCTVVLNKQMQLFYAAALLKKKYGDKIKIVSVVHSDAKCLYLRSQMIDNYVDIFVATTSTIKQKLLEYGISENKIKYEANPIKLSSEKKHVYSKEGHPITIGYAGRLTKEVKRSDLLVKLIDCLEKLKCNYKFYIAGSGEYKEKIENYIYENNISGRVILCGVINKEDIGTFWKDKDICVVVSDKEGGCLSLAEAMVMGAIPVTTDFTASREYITECQYGYIVEKEDVCQMAKIIQKLEFERKLLPDIGSYIQKYAKDKFDYEKYKEFMKNVMK